MASVCPEGIRTGDFCGGVAEEAHAGADECALGERATGGGVVGVFCGVLGSGGGEVVGEDCIGIVCCERVGGLLSGDFFVSAINPDFGLGSGFDVGHFDPDEAFVHEGVPFLDSELKGCFVILGHKADVGAILLGGREVEVSLVEPQEDGCGADGIGDFEARLGGIDCNGSPGGPFLVPPCVGIGRGCEEGGDGYEGCSDECGCFHVVRLEFCGNAEGKEGLIGLGGRLGDLGDADEEVAIDVVDDPNRGSKSIAPKCPTGRLLG